jgi:hypothetical protein
MKKIKEHFYLLDLLKILTLLAIAILHANEFVFYTDIYPLGSATPVWHAMRFYARFFTLGGQVLISVIYFLFGYAEKSKKSLALIALFALVGQSVLALVFDAFEWDIYAYIAVSNILIITVPTFYQKSSFLILVSLFFLLVPTDVFQSLGNDHPFLVILTGLKSSYNSGSWPLLPWFWLTLLNYQLGKLVAAKRDYFEEMSFQEKVSWIFLILISLPFMGAYYWVPIGPNYYHFVFNQKPWVYWANILPFMLIMRFSLLHTVQKKSKNLKLIHWISQLYWIKHLGLTYLLSIIYLGIGMRFSMTFQQHPMMFDIFFIGIMPISEITGRIIIKFYQQIRR